MEKFIHEQNLAHFQRLLTALADGPQREQILALLAEEEAKGLRAPNQDVIGTASSTAMVPDLITSA